MLFDNTYRTGEFFNAKASIEEIAAEPRLVGVYGLREAYSRGGPLTRRIIDALSPDIQRSPCPSNLYPIIDTRCQRLMPGMYSAIPGWHCDDWPRDNYYGQPDPTNINDQALHFTANIDTEGGRLAPTEILMGPIDLTLDPRRVWKSVHCEVENLFHRQLCVHDTNQTLIFGPRTIHRASPARIRGWRFWFRLSYMHRKPEKTLTVGPEQVYVVSNGNGW